MMVLASQNEDAHRFKNLAEDATYVTKDVHDQRFV